MSGVAGGVDAGAGGVSPALSFCLRKSLEQDKGPVCGGHGAESGPLGARSVQYGKSVGYQGSTQAGGRICQYPVSAVGRLYGFSDNWAVGGQIFCCQETTHILYYLRLHVGEAAGGERFGAFLAKGLQGLRQPTDMNFLSTTEKITPGSESITGGVPDECEAARTQTCQRCFCRHRRAAGGNGRICGVAACCTAVAAEAALTGLGAGGVALVRHPDSESELIDFFVTAPGRGRPQKEYAARRTLDPYEVPFRAHTQLFNVGPSSCAVPGLPSGLATLHKRHGRLPLPEVVAPAVRAADTGVPVVEQQEYLHDILEGILTRHAAARDAFAPRGNFLRRGEKIHIRGLAETLQSFGEEGSEPFTTGRFAHMQAEVIEDMGGLLTAEDLAAYRPVIRKPIQTTYRGHGILTNPPPSLGGTLIAHTLSILDRAASQGAGLGPMTAADRALVLLQAFAQTEAQRRRDT